MDAKDDLNPNKICKICPAMSWDPYSTQAEGDPSSVLFQDQVKPGQAQVKPGATSGKDEKTLDG